MLLRTKLLLAAAAIFLSIPSAAMAQYPGWGGRPSYYGGIAGGYGLNGYGFGYTGTVRNYTPPYFSLYPPVYYSHEIVRRPMGSSPYAYPSTYERSSGSSYSSAPALAPSAPANPVWIHNPFVKAKGESLPRPEEQHIQNSPAAAADQPLLPETDAKESISTAKQIVNPFVN